MKIGKDLSLLLDYLLQLLYIFDFILLVHLIVLLFDLF